MAAIPSAVIGAASNVNSQALSSTRTFCVASQIHGSIFASGLRPRISLVLRSNKISKRHLGPIFVAQKAAQTESKELEEDEVEELREETSEVGRDVSFSSIVDGLRNAIASSDEASIASSEAQLRAIEEEKESLGKKVGSLLEEVQLGKERILRLNADFDNFRKRSEGEKLNLSTSVKADVVESLLPIVDNFERAKASIKADTEGEQRIDKSYQGIYKQFVEVMKGLGVVAVETVGKSFNPEVHEAIMREDSTEYQEGIVIQEFRRGFSLGGRLLRPAMVKVSAGPGENKGSLDGAMGEESMEGASTAVE